MSEHIVEKDAPDLRFDVELLLGKYAGRSKWVGYEQPRREAWAEIERDLRNVLRRHIPPGSGGAS